ncbi:IgGFc-binding protein [Holothuria leucospilota]|uniref:IgGFc-binding protein n=1 Tax=Holothuria leucospilota TaxID=206669 RepID=A0A9Q1HFI1_HOLLE|nr:IgGFc-binding protein [Holothuria leucospilota]
MDCLLLASMMLVCSLAITDGQNVATFVRYQIVYNYMTSSGGDRFVQEVFANATSAADSDVISGINLWKITLYASTNEDGSGQIQVFPDVQLTPEKASQTLQSGGTLVFTIPMGLNMDQLEGFTHLCLKTAKNPAANPDFVLTFKQTDELNLCMPINFNVPIIEHPEPPSVDVVQIEENGQKDARFLEYHLLYNYVATAGGGRHAQQVFVNATSSSASDLITGTDLWKITLYASTSKDGSGETQVFPDVQLTPEQASQTLQPGGTLMFDINMGLNLDELEGFTHLCLKTEKNPAANPDFVLTFNQTDELNLCMPINFDVPIIEYPDPPVLVPEVTKRVEITKVNANMTFNQIAKTSSFVVMDVFYNFAFGGSTDVIQGENLWQMKFLASQNDDGTGGKRVLSTIYQGYQSSTVEPDTALTFQAAQSFDFLEEYGPGQLFEFLCITFSKHPQADVDISFPDGESATVCERLPAIEVEMPPPGPNRTCHLWGDPHQKTFDGYGYTHQGDYEYIAVTICNGDESVNDFEIVVDNFRRIPSKPVTYIREIRLYYNDVVYALTHPDEVSVDGVKVTLPYTDVENGVTIHYAAPHKILTTNFGLAIRFDNMHNSDITLPLRYRNKVCGLCGNFDDDRTNECHYRNGTTMGVHNEDCKLDHAKEWKFDTPDEPEYPEDFKPALRPCSEGSDMMNMSMASCGIITDTAGPLANCHDHVEPEIYYNTCVYDLCQLLPEMFFLCSSVETYVYDCQRASNWETEIGDWRSVATACEPPCTEDMTFNPYGPPCPPNCADPDGTHTSCAIPRLEMCFCPEGKLLDGTKCIDPEECGCKMENGRYLSVGEEFVARDCSEYCACEGRGNLQCRSMECVENAQCSVKAGVRNCYCDDGYMGNGREECNTAGKVCHIYGDPHFHTFDEEFYSFQGDCTYVASETCGDLPRGLTPFRLLIHNDALIPEERFTYLTQLRLHFKGRSFKLRYTGEISYNGQDIANQLPFDDGSISVRREGGDIVAVTSFGLKIIYDGENDAEILLPPDYFGHVCGLCGNADGNSTNDKQKPDGTLDDVRYLCFPTTIQAKKLEFANSWGVGGCPQLDEPVVTCEVGTKDYEKAVDVCSLLRENPGPFAHCHDFKNPGKFVTSCIFDLCGTLPSTDLFCSSAQSYLRACAEKGGSLDTDWKSKVKYCGTPTCSEGYENFRQSCYKFVRTPTDFSSAEEICRNEGAHLVTISSRAENEYVAELSEGVRSWMGARRQKSAGETSYDSKANDVYTFLPNRLVRGIGSFRFSVKSHSDARLLLSSTKDVDDETPVYEIVLGADRNKRNFLRRCMICEPKVENTKPSKLHKHRARDFFVNFHEGNIQVGDMKDRDLILEFRDPLPMRVRYVAFKSVARSGSWTFYDNEFAWDTAEEWTYDNYRFGEPSNFQSEENCLETNFLQAGLWNDHFCEDQKAFVCENDGL